MDFEVDRPSPADSPPGDLLITIVKETVILYNILSFEKWKKVKGFRLSNWSDGDENTIDCEIARDCVNRGNVVIYIMYRNFRQEAHSYPQADIWSAPYSDHDDTHNRASRCGAPQASFDRCRH